MENERLKQQFAFCLEADKEKKIGRQTYISDASRKENDAEHAWHMALMTLILSEYANEEIDVLRTISMILIHDIVEIDAGDTYAYDEEAKKSQKEREEKAADRIFSMLPEDQKCKFRELWEEFEAQETKEAKFARTMDNIQPMIRGKHGLVLMASMTTGFTAKRSIEAIGYYGGYVAGAAALYSAVRDTGGYPVASVYTLADIPDYASYDYRECPYCKQGQKIDALVNSFGYSEL